MKISRLFVPFLSILILNSTISSNLILKTAQNDKKLSSYVCKITKDITKSKTDTQDVLIGNMGGTRWSTAINEVTECIGSDKTVIISDFNEPLTTKSLKKATVVILALGQANQNTVVNIIRTHIQSTVWNHKAKIFVIVSNRISAFQRLQVIQTFISFGFFDISIAYVSQNNEVKLELYQTWKSDLKVLTNPDLIELKFSEKWIDMAGVHYKIIAYPQAPRVLINSTGTYSALLHFLDTVVKHQNAAYRIVVIHDLSDFIGLWRKRNFHLSLSYGFHIDSDEPKLLTYEEISYCAMVPLPPKTSLFRSIFIKPFDGLTWLFLVVTMACCVAVWWMFRDRGAIDSPWLLAYGMVVMLIGQGVEFSRKNLLVLAILLELVIVMIWILNQAYEGVITSFMIQPIHENRLEAFDDLVASNYEIMTDETFTKSISSSDAYNVLKTRLYSSTSMIGDQFHQEISRQHYIFIMTCDQAEVIVGLGLSNDRKPISELYYLLPEKFLRHLMQLEASYLNPFLERFQYYMDLSFQAGLLQIWEYYHLMDMPYKKSKRYNDEFKYLKLADLFQVFSIIIIGCILSIVLLLIEILFHDVLKKLKFANIARKLRNQVHQMAYKKRKQPRHPKYQKGALYYIMHRHKRVKRLKTRKLKVRRIFVQPRFPMD